ncbi:MAG: pyridoxal-phosphate dependent enzyme [Clostridia bacterium]|nr:pyridoxal-phosphate dependent enzyme [Clostridia bacterium]
MMKLETFGATPLYLLDTDDSGNQFFIKREDMLPYSFGGNKARIGAEYLADMLESGCNHMVAYGNARSNLCRVLSNLCAGERLPITIITPADDDGERREAFNGKLCELFGANIVPCFKTNVAETVDQVLDAIRQKGGKPYYIYGDRTGQGNRAVPVRAYQKAWAEIRAQGTFDKIVLALGTGMTQAGLLCGMKDDEHKPEVMGISIARDEESARRHILSYITACAGEDIGADIRICDRFRAGYGVYGDAITDCIHQVMVKYGIPLDGTYTAKAFHGMMTLAKEENWQGQKVLFIHTGGTPLFFDSQR